MDSHIKTKDKSTITRNNFVKSFKMCVAVELFQAPLLSKKHRVKDNDDAFSQEGYFLEMLRKEHCIFPIKSRLPFKPEVNVKLIKGPQGKKPQLHWVMMQENKMDFRLLLHCSLMGGGIQRGLNSPPLVFQMRKLKPERQLLAQGHPVTLLLRHLGPQHHTMLEFLRNPNPSFHSRPPESEARKMKLSSLCLKPHRISLKQQKFLLAGSHIFQSS